MIFNAFFAIIFGMKKPELLLPAGTLDRLKTAFMYGADAVYAGMPAVSLRNKTSFTFDEMKEGIDYAHTLGKKVYLAMNLFTHNHDIPKLAEFVSMLDTLRPDGVIVADPGVFAYVKEKCPWLPLHISTQANVCSALTVNYWKDQGASLVVLGRETPLKEIKEIREQCPDIRLEMFIHGALCISYSGRCLLSNFMTGRSANKGNCAHSCRWKYKVYLEEENRPNELMEISEDEHGTYIMNSKDLCLLDRLNDILPVGIDSFKIEGRNKSEYYAAITARAYRAAIDAWFDNPEQWQATPYKNELLTLQSRGYTTGFLDGNAGPEAHNYDVSASTGCWRYAGQVLGTTEDRLLVLLKHKLTVGMELEVLIPGQWEPYRFKITEMFNHSNHNPVEAMSAGPIDQQVELVLDKQMLKKIPPLTVIRTKITE